MRTSEIRSPAACRRGRVVLCSRRSVGGPCLQTPAVNFTAFPRVPRESSSFGFPQPIRNAKPLLSSRATGRQWCRPGQCARAGAGRRPSRLMAGRSGPSPGCGAETCLARSQGLGLHDTDRGGGGGFCEITQFFRPDEKKKFNLKKMSRGLKHTLH